MLYPLELRALNNIRAFRVGSLAVSIGPHLLPLPFFLSPNYNCPAIRPAGWRWARTEGAHCFVIIACFDGRAFLGRLGLFLSSR
jgi:hypothetical protein